MVGSHARFEWNFKRNQIKLGVRTPWIKAVNIELKNHQCVYYSSRLLRDFLVSLPLRQSFYTRLPEFNFLKHYFQDITTLLRRSLVALHRLQDSFPIVKPPFLLKTASMSLLNFFLDFQQSRPQVSAPDKIIFCPWNKFLLLNKNLEETFQCHTLYHTSTYKHIFITLVQFHNSEWVQREKSDFVQITPVP